MKKNHAINKICSKKSNQNHKSIRQIKTFGRWKYILLLLSFIMTVSLQVLLNMTKWENPENKHEIANKLCKLHSKAKNLEPVFVCGFTSHSIFFHSYGDALNVDLLSELLARFFNSQNHCGSSVHNVDNGYLWEPVRATSTCCRTPDIGTVTACFNDF